MIAVILVLLSLFTVLFAAIVGVVVSFHFRKFGLPEDLFRKRLMGIFEIGCLFMVLFNIVLLAINVWKK